MSIKSEVTRINSKVTSQHSAISNIADALNSKLGTSISKGENGTPLEQNSTTLSNIFFALNNYTPSNSSTPFQLVSEDVWVDLQGSEASVYYAISNGSTLMIEYYDDSGGWNEISPSYHGGSPNLIGGYILSLTTGNISYYNSDTDYGFFDAPGPDFSGLCLMVLNL